MKMPEPVAWMYDFSITCDDEVYTNWVTQDPTEVGKEVEGIRNVRTLYSADQMREVINSAAQICQRWIDDHSKSDNCTYNDCDMVAAVTDVMNEIKGMMK